MSQTLSGNPAYAQYSTAPLNDLERSDVRQYCGYPTYGNNNQAFVGYRFFVAYGTLEYKMNNLAPAEYQKVRGIVAACYLLENAIPAASANLDTDKAAVWTHNRDEVRHRAQLYAYWRKELCKVIGIPPGPGLEGGGNNMRIIV